MGSLIVTAAWELSVVAYGIKFPDQGSKPGPLHWEHGVLATGPPGKSQELFLLKKTMCGVTENCHFLVKVLKKYQAYSQAPNLLTSFPGNKTTDHLQMLLMRVSV